MNKRTILGMENHHSHSPLRLHSFMVKSGNVTNIEQKWMSHSVVEIHTELLKVAILEDLQEDDAFIEANYLKNYEGEIDYGEGGPTIEEVD